MADTPTIRDWTLVRGEPDGVHVGEPHVVNQYRGYETHFNLQNERFCGLFRAGNGNLVGVWGMRPDMVLPRGVSREHYLRAYTGVRVSKDGGVTWGPMLRLDEAGNKGGTTPGGEVLLPAFLTAYEDSRTLRMPTARSGDGRTWELDMEVRVRFPEGCTLIDAERWDYPPGYASMWYWGKIYPADNGVLLGTMYGLFEEADDEHCWQAILIRSEDDGRSWDYVATIAGGTRPVFHQATEPCIEPLGGGRFVAAFRSGEEPRVLGQCWSNDGGRTWTVPVAAPGLRNVSADDRQHRDPDGDVYRYGGGNVSPVFARLANGTLAVAYGRPGIQVALSRDGEGRDWDRVVELVPKQPPYSLGHTEGTSGMPGIVAAEPDRFLVLYDVHNYTPDGTPHGYNTVFLREIRVEG